MYTKISKPGPQTYIRIQAYLPIYDDPAFTYNDPNLFYNGVSPAMYTNIAKPTGGTITATAGLYMGVGVLTYSGNQVLSPGNWTKINKPT